MRTYSRDVHDQSLAAWLTFKGPRWAQVRSACQSWTIFPPSSEGQDWRDAPHPSQRVIVWFALENRPAETLDMIRRARNWTGVIDRIFASEGQIRSGIKWAEEEADLERAYQREAYRGSMLSIGELLGRMNDSIGGKP